MWFWIVVFVEIAVFAIIIFKALKLEDERPLSSSRIEDELQTKILERRVLEFFTLLLAVLGLIMDVYGFFQPLLETALSLIVVGGFLIIGGIFLFMHFREERIKFTRELKMARENRKEI